MPVSIIENFQLGTNLPLDARYVADTYFDVSLYWYAGMQVFQESDNQLYWYDGSVWYPVVDTSLSEYSPGKNIDISSGVISLVDNIEDIKSISFDTSLINTDTSHGPGVLHWHSDVNFLTYGTIVDPVHISIGRDSMFYAVNLTGQTIPKGRAVSLIDASGGIPSISPTDGTSPFANVAGITTSDILDQEFGYVQFAGKIHNLNTSSYGEGDYLRLEPSTSGSIGDTTPPAPNPITFIGIVTKSDPSDGEILLTIDNAPKLSFLPDVNSRFTTADGQVLIYDGSNLYWDNIDFSTAIQNYGGALQSEVDLYNSIQDISISNNAQAIQNLDSSLDLYVLKSGDIMTGPLTATNLTAVNDISIGGALYLGSDIYSNGADTDLLAVVTASGKIVTTSIPAGNIELGVTDVSMDIDVSILSGIFYVDTSLGDVTITLPVIDASKDGRSFNIIKKTDDSNEVIVQVTGLSQQIGNSFIQIISQQDKGFRLVADKDNSKYLITQDSRFLEGNTQGEFQYWDISLGNWRPTTDDITWDNDNLEFKVGGNSSPITFRVDASSDIVYINAEDISVNNPSDDLGFYAGGRGAFGDSVTIERLRNNVPGNVPRALSLIDTTGVLRIWRFVANANDPGVELVWGTDDSPSSVNNAWWDFFLDGANDGTDSFSIRRRTGGTDLKILEAFSDRLEIVPTTESTSPTSGALQVAGGAGVNGNLNTLGAVNPGGSETNSSFPATTEPGSIFFRTDLNMLFVYDASRSKWLSIDRQTFTSGRDNLPGNTSGYFGIADLQFTSTEGFLIPRNGTIVSASFINANTITRNIRIVINNDLLGGITLGLSSQNSIIENNLNLDVSAGDIVQTGALANGIANGITRGVCTFEIAWRE